MESGVRLHILGTVLFSMGAEPRVTGFSEGAAAALDVGDAEG